MERVDIDEAHAAVGDVLDAWRATTRWGDAPPFTGGVWDWPQRLTQGLVFLKHEMQAVQAFLKHEEEVKRGSPAEHQR